MAVRLGIMATGLLALIGFAIHATVGKGLLAGGLAGVLAFWVIALQTEKLASRDAVGVHSGAQRWSLLQYVLYAAVLYWAYTLDQQNFYGVIGAVIGLFIIRVVQVVLGFTGLDLKKESEADGTDR